MTQMLSTKKRMVTVIMPKVKNLINWVMTHTDWTQGNNLAETRLIIKFYNGEDSWRISAETLCVNEYGSKFSTERYLDVECPSCFSHIFSTTQVFVFDI